MSQIIAPIVEVVFICTHPAPAAQFADFVYTLESNGVSTKVLAAEGAYAIFQDRKVKAENFYPDPNAISISFLTSDQQEALASELVKTSNLAKIVITDVASLFSAKVEEAFSNDAPDVMRIAYYDNPEGYVPGGYSEMAEKVIAFAQEVLFANANLVNSGIYAKQDIKIDLKDKKLIALGYSPLPKDSEMIRKEREDKANRENVRKKFFADFKIQDKGQKIGVYFGGANEVYYDEAFPKFLEIVQKSQEALNGSILVLQQHPRAYIEGNFDGNLLESFKKKTKALIFISKEKYNDALVACDYAMYYQTSANAKFLLSGIPTLQIGHEVYPDILVKNGLCKSATTPKEFQSFIASLPNGPLQVDTMKIYELLGIKENWSEILIQTVQTSNPSL